MKYTFFILSIILFLSSCEKYIDFEGEYIEPKITVNSILESDSVYRVHLNRSLSVIESSELSAIEDAEVNIFGDNIFIESLTYDSNGLYKGQLKPNAGVEYRLEVSAPDYESVSSSFMMPSAVVIADADTATYINELDEERLEISFSFDDDGSQDNFYAIRVYAVQIVNGEIFENQIGIQSSDPILGIDENDFEVNEVIFNDNVINGTEASVTFHVSEIRQNFDFARVELISVSEELYEYLVTLDAYLQTTFNPFAQPVSIANNIEGGLGIFGGFQVSSAKINF